MYVRYGVPCKIGDQCDFISGVGGGRSSHGNGDPLYGGD